MPDPGHIKHLTAPLRITARGLAALIACASIGSLPATAIADEGGASFWVPGQFGSLMSVPGEPGWSLNTLYYHASSSGSATQSFPTTGGVIAVGLGVRADLLFLDPTYTFERPLLGGQAAVAIGVGPGGMNVSADATYTGPLIGRISGHASDAVTGVSDLYPLGTLKWRRGNNNYMAYTMIGAPAGTYEHARGRLANIGLNHWSVDAGGGYTYFNTSNGREFSVIAGLTYNFENSATQYQNGIDGHIDWAASQFLSESFHAGVAGYLYRQLSADSGSGALLGSFESRTNGAGPQVGYFFPFGRGKGYVNMKAFWEFDASHRTQGWNTWLTLSLPFGDSPK